MQVVVEGKAAAAVAVQVVAVAGSAAAEPAFAVGERPILEEPTAVAAAVAMVELVGGTRYVAAEHTVAEAPNKLKGSIIDFQNDWNNMPMLRK